MNFVKNLKKIEGWTLIIIIFLFPIVYSPPSLFSESYLMPKTLLLLFGILIITLLKLSAFLIGKKIKLKYDKTFVLLAIFTIIYTISAIFVTPNKMEAFFFPGSVLLAIISLFYYQFISKSSKKTKEKLVYALIFSGLVASIFTIVSSLNIIKNLDPGLFGERLPNTIFLASLVPLVLGKFLKSKSADQRIITMISAFFIVMATSMSLYNLMPGKDTSLKLPNMATSWSITMDSLKESPFLGIGPGNYLSAFNKFVPLSYNSTILFNTRFSLGSSFVLTTLTESGIFGFATFLVAIIYIVSINIKTCIKKKEVSEKSISLAFLLIMLAILPANHLLWLLFVVILGSNSDLEYFLKIEKKLHSTFLKIAISVAGTIPLVIASIFFIRAYFAEYNYTKAIRAISNNDAKKTYEALQTATTLSPGVDRYKITFAQVNYALAESKAGSLGEFDSKEEKEKKRLEVSLFLDQSIAQAKAAVTLNPERSSSWAELGSIYELMIPLAQGADNFAIQSFSQAIALDPINPNTRITLGSIFYNQKEYEKAIDTFKLAVLAKPDLPNSHYNLAISYRESGELDKAKEEFNITLSLLEKTSAEYELVKNESEIIEEIIPPQEPQEPIIDPKVELLLFEELE